MKESIACQVRTDTRRGHHVTLIHGLEAHCFDSFLANKPYWMDTHSSLAFGSKMFNPSRIKSHILLQTNLQSLSKTCKAGVFVETYHGCA